MLIKSNDVDVESVTQVAKAHLDGWAVTVDVNRPYVTTILSHDSEPGYAAIGIAKISGRDEWDPQVGFEISIRRAVKRFLRRSLCRLVQINQQEEACLTKK